MRALSILILTLLVTGCATSRPKPEASSRSPRLVKKPVHTDFNDSAIERRSVECRRHSYTNSPPLLWITLPLTLHVTESVPSPAIQAILRAGRRWNKAAGLEIFKFKRIDNKSLAAKPGLNSIVWDTETSPDNHLQVAFTRTNFYVPIYLRAEVRIFAKGRMISVGGPAEPFEPDLESILVHEYGHILGLDHRESGTMNAESDLLPKDREIDPESIAAVKCLYQESLNSSAGQRVPQ